MPPEGKITRSFTDNMALFDLDVSVASPFAIKCGYDEGVAVAVVRAKMINKRPVEKGPA